MSENYYVCREENGSINISEEVIGAVIKNAVFEVEGVASLANTAGTEIAELIGIKTVSKGIQVSINESSITADVIITINYGSNIVEIGKKVQEAVIDAIQSASGAEDIKVNVHVSGISFQK